MSSPQDVFVGPRLKVERANTHIRELIWLTQPLNASLYTLEVENIYIAPYVDKRRFELNYKPTRPIPESLGLVIGDAIHNLRASLDHLASGIVRRKQPSANPYFPVGSRDKLENSGALAAMEAALPGSKALILENIRPINDSRDGLWRTLQSLDIEDKHNLIIPTVNIVTIEKFVGRVGQMEFFNCAFSNDASKPFCAISSPEPIEIYHQPNILVEVKFGSGTPLQEHLVVQSLTEASKMVVETLDAFADLVGA